MKRFKRVSACFTALLIIVSMPFLAACSVKDKMPAAPLSPTHKDIISQKITPKGKIPVTVLVKYAFSINSFERAAEEKFPQLDIVQVGNHTSDRGLVEYERRLKNDDLTDIVMTWPLDIGAEYWNDRLLDLSGMSFTGNYNTSMLDTIAQDGKLYYLPGPAQVRGILYNKTLFAEKGWEVPKDFDSFVELCRTIEADGIRSIQLGFKHSEVLDTAFVGYSYGDCFSKPSDATWLNSFNMGEGDFGEQFAPALQTFQYMIDKGVWKASDLDISYAKREEMFFSRQCAMIEDSVLMAKMGETRGSTDEFALMPFFSPTAKNEWVRLYMVCYIGLNKHLAEPQNKEKYDLVLQLMEYISSPEGQSALAADTGAMYSSVKGVPPPDIPEIQDLIPALNEGRHAIFPELRNAQSALREGLAGMVRGNLTADDVVKMVNEQNASGATAAAEEVIGQAESDFTKLETGNYITDLMRTAGGTEIALFLDSGKDGRTCGKGVFGRFYKGDQTSADITRIIADTRFREMVVLQKITMTGKDLKNALEHTLIVDGLGGWFYYFSGLRMEYAVAAEPGNRIRKITDMNGNAIDDNKLYTVAVMDKSVDEKFIKSTEETGILVADLIINDLSKGVAIKPSTDNRFVVVEP